MWQNARRLGRSSLLRNEGRRRWLLSWKLVEIRHNLPFLLCCLSFPFLEVTRYPCQGRPSNVVFELITFIWFLCLVEIREEGAGRNGSWETGAVFWELTYDALEKSETVVLKGSGLWETVMLLETRRITLPLQSNIIFTCYHPLVWNVLEFHENEFM